MAKELVGVKAKGTKVVNSGIDYTIFEWSICGGNKMKSLRGRLSVGGSFFYVIFFILALLLAGCGGSGGGEVLRGLLGVEVRVEEVRLERMGC
jgi:hypothetical protein